MALSFRRARPADAYTLTVLTRAFFPYTRFTTEKIARRLTNPRIRYYLARLDGRTVGFVDFRFDAASGRVMGLAVLNEHRRRGIGEKLFRLALRETKKVRKRYAVVLVDPLNAPALALYNKYGFRFWKKSGKRLDGREMVFWRRNLFSRSPTSKHCDRRRLAYGFWRTPSRRR